MPPIITDQQARAMLDLAADIFRDPAVQAAFAVWQAQQARRAADGPPVQI